MEANREQSPSLRKDLVGQMRMLRRKKTLESEENQKLVLILLKLPVKRSAPPSYPSMDKNLMLITMVGYLETIMNTFPPPQQPSSMRLKLRH